MCQPIAPTEIPHPQPPPFPDADAAILEAYRCGQTVVQIATGLHVRFRSVSALLHAYGFRLRGEPLRPFEKAAVVAAYLAGGSVWKIAGEWRVSKGQVAAAIREAGHELTPRRATIQAAAARRNAKLLKFCGGCKLALPLSAFPRAHHGRLVGRCQACRSKFFGELGQLQARSLAVSRSGDLSLPLRCSLCRLEKPASEFRVHSKTKSGRENACAQCERARVIQRRAADAETFWAKRREYYLLLRAETILAYGGRCQCCGEREPPFLTLDHIYGDGAAQRRALPGGPLRFYSWLKKAGFPTGRVRCLCWNCNCARGRFGYCPHEQLSLAERATRREANRLRSLNLSRPLAARTEQYRQQAMRRRDRLRDEVITAYGRTCRCCGAVAPEFLTVDHVFGAGRTRADRGKTDLYVYLRKSGFPQAAYRLLCYNCNLCAGMHGACVHPNGVRTGVHP